MQKNKLQQFGIIFIIYFSIINMFLFFPYSRSGCMEGTECHSKKIAETASVKNVTKLDSH